MTPGLCAVAVGLVWWGFVAAGSRAGAIEVDAGPDVTAVAGGTVTLSGRLASGAAGGAVTRWRVVTDPQVSEPITSLEGPTNWAEQYGTRIRGFLHPPVDGEYRFWISSDDNGELWLSRDSDPANRRLAAHVAHWTGPRQWDAVPTQQSEPIVLRAGKAYHIDVLHKEAGGGDNLSVAWCPPGGDREVIPGRFLSPHNDGPAGPTGSIVREVWKGIPGGMADLLRSPSFSAEGVVVDGADVLSARVTLPRGGSYLFELTAAVGRRTVSDRVRVLAVDGLRNGDFEAGESGRPGHWVAEGPPEVVAWVRGAGVDGSTCVSISSSSPASASWRQGPQLRPYRAYRLTGMLRGRDLKAGRDTDYAAAIGVSMYRAQFGPGAEVSELDWTPSCPTTQALTRGRSTAKRRRPFCVSTTASSRPVSRSMPFLATGRRWG